MFVVQTLANRPVPPDDSSGEKSHSRYGLHNDRIVSSRCRIRTPGKRSVIGH